jgi:TolA-binding protein
MESDVAELSIPDRLWAWFVTHKREIIWGAGLLVAGAIGAGFFMWRQDEAQRAANHALSRITTAGITGTEQSTSVDALLKVAAEYQNTDAAGRALLLAGADLFAEGKYPEAKAQFERFLRQYRQSPFADQALLGVAACLDAQGKITEAVTAYNNLVQHYSTESVAPPAKLALAGLYAKQGKLEPARDLYMELSRGQYGSISSEAAIHLDALAAKHAEGIRIKPAFTNAPALEPPSP